MKRLEHERLEARVKAELEAAIEEAERGDYVDFNPHEFEPDAFK